VLFSKVKQIFLISPFEEVFLLYNLFMPNDIKEMFDNIAKNYDKLNNIISLKMHLCVKKHAIANVPLKPDFKVLDVCTGTGDIAIYLAENIIKNGDVTGLDFSEEMLKIAKNKAKNIENLKLITGDALNLPFKDGEFDACFISFGLRNLTDLKKGLQEMKRVTKEGGFIVNIDTGKPKGIVGFFFNLFFFHLVPLLGYFFHGDSSPYKYLPESTKNFPSLDELVKIFEELGFKNVKKHDFLLGAISQQIGEV